MGESAPCAVVVWDVMVLDRRLVLLARVPWINGCALRFRSLSDAPRCWIGEYMCMWLIMLSANLQAIHVPLLGHTSDEKINEEDEGRAVANHRFRGQCYIR